jgi:hypothetical protein
MSHCPSGGGGALADALPRRRALRRDSLGRFAGRRLRFVNAETTGWP